MQGILVLYLYRRNVGGSNAILKRWCWYKPKKEKNKREIRKKIKEK
jgi:hypothetical protein